MKMLTGVLALAVVASAAAAQGGGGMAGMPMNHDADKNTKQTGPLPAGWTVRVDRPTQKAEDLNFTVMGPGMHVATGPAGIFWNPANTATGTYTVSAKFGVRSTPLHDAYGLFWGGSDLNGDKESYGYFIVYGDGSFTVKHRAGSNSGGRGSPGDVHTVIDKTPNAAIVAAPADGGAATNTLEVRVAADSVRFVVNGKEVGAADAKNPMMPTGGIYGFRVNHNIEVHVGEFNKK
jgi:hypothetical protein